MTDLVEIVARAIGDAADEMHISQLRLAAQAAIAAARPVIEAEVLASEDGELLTIAWMDGSHRSTKAHRELIRNLRETGDRLAMFATHDFECDSHMGHKVLPCNCGYTTIINAWKELQP